MKVNPNMFRGYDIRGIVGEDLFPEVVEAIAKAHGTVLKRRGVQKAVVGHDCRQTSKEYAKVAARGLSWAGLDVVNIGMELIGTFRWSQYFLNCRGGIYITASHNPAEYNGLKLAVDFSETTVTEGIQENRKMVENDEFEEAPTHGNIEEINVRQAYFDELLKRFNFKKKLKVVVDPACSTSGEIVPEILRQAGFEVVEKNCKIDPSFPLGTADPTDVVLAERLAKETISEKADIGLSFDADGDRIGIADEKGNIIWNDVLLAVFATSVLRKHPGEIIMYNTLCSKVVEETILREGGKPFMWRTGHAFLMKKNQEVGAAFIGELSGHFFFSRDFYNHDDGIYSCLYLLEYLGDTEKTLSEIVDDLPKYISSPEIKVFCSDDRKVSLMNDLAIVAKEKFPEAEIISDERAGDGVRVNFEDSMFVIRYSQNGPYITIKFEAKTKERYEFLKKYISDLLHSYYEIDWKSAININIESFE